MFCISSNVLADLWASLAHSSGLPDFLWWQLEETNIPAGTQINISPGPQPHDSSRVILHLDYDEGRWQHQPALWFVESPHYWFIVGIHYDFGADVYIWGSIYFEGGETIVIPENFYIGSGVTVLQLLPPLSSKEEFALNLRTPHIIVCPQCEELLCERDERSKQTAQTGDLENTVIY
ncbi:hypothetical protein DFH09DRAFT_1088416 [Mycena vulgaris]|nr:hypothetical protein DFH09DRAFT_1088416 [Mycena vulgaris]